MESWDEVRTAYHVARKGTVSGAADVMGVHHATVIRHIDALEARLGVKLFQRHARGYTATEAGRDLLSVAQTTDDQFAQLEGRIKGRGDAVTGELIVTTLTALSPMIIPTLIKFQNMHPDLIVRLLTGERVFRLEYGEAHVALRAGSKPSEPDNVVQELLHQRGSMYAAQSYIDEFGMPDCETDLPMHRFVSSDSETPGAPFDKWIRQNVPAANIVFRAQEQWILQRAVLAGAGIGHFSDWEAARHPQLVQVIPSKEDWKASIWLVTHVDLHRTTKVQAFTNFIKDEAPHWV